MTITRSQGAHPTESCWFLMPKTVSLLVSQQQAGMYTLQDLLFSASLAVYVAVGVFVAMVRWGHRCEPYGRHMDYYYPAWRAVIFCFLTNLFMAPAIFLPEEADAVLQLRLLLILASPFFCAVLMFAYFGKALKVTTWRRPVVALAFPFGVMALTATVLALVPGRQMDEAFCRWFFAVGGVLALAFLTCFVTATRMIARAMRRFSEENWSNPEDFPTQYASSVIWIPMLHLVVSWVAAFVGTKPVLSVGLLLLSALGVVFLISALSPHRAMEVERLEEGEDASEPAEVPGAEPAVEEIPLDRQEEIVRAIRHYVEDGRAYLNSHLTLSELARGIGFNRGYVSGVMNSRLGGFFAYVNRCRYAHVAQLKVEQPDTPIGELIDASGFGSRSTYYTIRKRLEE